MTQITATEIREGDLLWQQPASESFRVGSVRRHGRTVEIIGECGSFQGRRHRPRLLRRRRHRPGLPLMATDRPTPTTDGTVATEPSPVHVVSATGFDDGSHAMMCGELWPSYRSALDAGHLVGNYASPGAIRRSVTCVPCRDKTLAAA